jgi:hypothetical protein
MLKMLLESIPTGKERARLLWLAGLTVAAIGWGISEVPNPQIASVVGSGNRMGQLGPCGCAVNPRGGIARLVQWRQGTKPALWVDSGENLFALPEMNLQLASVWKAKALLLADAYRHLGIHYMLPGGKDFAAGPEFLADWFERSAIRAIAANLLPPKTFPPFWSSWAQASVGAENWIVTGVVSSAFLPKGWVVEDPEKALRVVLDATANTPSRRVLVLSTLTLAQNKRLAETIRPDWILASSDDITDAVVQHGTTQIFHQRREAQSLLAIQPPEKVDEVWLDETWDAKTKLAKSWETRSRVVSTENRSIAIRANPSAIPRGGKAGSKLVANAYICKQCHLPQHQFWEKTQHASAYLVLFAKDQHFDPECVACHSLGFGNRNGFTSIADPLILKGVPPRKSGQKPVLETILEEAFVDEKNKSPLDSRKEPERYLKLKQKFHQAMDQRALRPGWEKVFAGVQCEHCHGNRWEHAHSKKPGAPTASPVSSQVCTQCHTPQRDPDFAFSKKLPQVACPRISRN